MRCNPYKAAAWAAKMTAKEAASPAPVASGPAASGSAMQPAEEPAMQPAEVPAMQPAEEPVDPILAGMDPDESD